MKNLLRYFVCVLVVGMMACTDEQGYFSGEGTVAAGSFASFVIVGDYLYAINGTAIKTFELTENGGMTQTDDLELFATLETIFPYESMLLVGSQQGVFFLDRSNPSNLRQISVYTHITACDPVVAKDSIAYSTLRGSTDCRFGNISQLDVIDFSEVRNPIILRSYDSVEPLGLGIRGRFLFVCENSGLTMYDAADPSNLVVLDQLMFDGAIAFDVIPTDQYLIVTTNRGIFNVQFADTGNMRVIGQVTSI